VLADFVQGLADAVEAGGVFPPHHFDFIGEPTVLQHRAYDLSSFDVVRGEVIAALHRRHRAVEFKKFLIRMTKTVPVHLQIRLIVDNYASDKTPAIKFRLANTLGPKYTSSQTGSSWPTPARPSPDDYDPPTPERTPLPITSPCSMTPTATAPRS
jgi:hypothetical protein